MTKLKLKFLSYTLATWVLVTMAVMFGLTLSIPTSVYASGCTEFTIFTVNGVTDTVALSSHKATVYVGDKVKLQFVIDKDNPGCTDDAAEAKYVFIPTGSNTGQTTPVPLSYPTPAIQKLTEKLTNTFNPDTTKIATGQYIYYVDTFKEASPGVRNQNTFKIILEPAKTTPPDPNQPVPPKPTDPNNPQKPPKILLQGVLFRK
jgi:hypothetical protein